MSARIGMSVLPNLSKAFCDVQTSNTISLSLDPNALWYDRPGGLPAPAFFSRLMHSSYCAADIAAGAKYTPIAIDSPSRVTRVRQDGGSRTDRPYRNTSPGLWRIVTRHEAPPRH